MKFVVKGMALFQLATIKDEAVCGQLMCVCFWVKTHTLKL